MKMCARCGQIVPPDSAHTCRGAAPVPPQRAIGDPADKAQGVDQFVAHRGGYGEGKLARALHAAERGHSLAAGEGALLVAHYRELLKTYAPYLDDLCPKDVPR